MNDTLIINYEKITASYDIVTSIERNFRNYDFHKNFNDIQYLISEINEKHDNCISGYKQGISEIIESIDKIENKINLLSDSLYKTISSYNSTNKKINNLDPNISSKNEIKNLVSTLVNDVSNIPLPEEVTGQQVEPQPYNTTPIGLGIAAAGITGAVGAVVIDSMNPKVPEYKNKELEVEEYHESNDSNDNYQDIELEREVYEDEENAGFRVKIAPSMTSYQASRDKKSIEKFYE